jgi:hypothetical protein
MGPRPWRPAAELEAALERGDLRYAVGLAEELRSPREYDAYALRWLARWASETGTATIEQAAEVAASLADLPAEPTAEEAIRTLL